MPAIDEDDRPKKKIVHEIGQDLALISVRELEERIALMKEEIARRGGYYEKQTSRNVADHFSRNSRASRVATRQTGTGSRRAAQN
jgi:uncharacterized small protein (DUF1192 family)